MKKLIKLFAISVLILPLTLGCNSSGEEQQKEANVDFQAPEWTKNATLYELNIRQYSEEGTLNKVTEDLGRIKELGIDIIWLMPIHPIGEKNRKGTLGSYYSIKNYKKVNPEFGTVEDLKSLVEKAHGMGMYVMLDWVANHTAWDNPMTEEHPEWYEQNEDGDFVSPYNWTDVIQLDYSNKGLWEYMKDAMKYWVQEADIDGFRCDYPGQIPAEFWKSTRIELEKIKRVFMLAEDEGNVAILEQAFDMNYSWGFFHAMNEVAKGEKTVLEMDSVLQSNFGKYPEEDYRIRFITNHDENSWNGTIEERLGAGSKAFAVITFTIPGMPLLYSGQEVGMNKRLKFFEKDLIEWKESPVKEFYRDLINLRKEHQVLWSGKYGGDFARLENSNPDMVYSFLRKKDNDEILVVVNLSDVDQKISVNWEGEDNRFTEYFNGESVSFFNNVSFDLAPWEYKIYIKD